MGLDVEVAPPQRACPLFSLAELTLLSCIANGLGDVDTGVLLDPVLPLSVTAVRSRVETLRRRCGARTRAHLVCLVLQWGVLKIPPPHEEFD